MVYPKEWFFFREAWKVRSNMANACDKDWWELSNILLVFIWNAGQKLILEIPEIYERKRFGQVDQKRHWINSNVTIYRYMYKNMKWMTIIGTHMNKKDRWMTQKASPIRRDLIHWFQCLLTIQYDCVKVKVREKKQKLKARVEDITDDSYLDTETRRF